MNRAAALLLSAVLALLSRAALAIQSSGSFVNPSQTDALIAIKAELHTGSAAGTALLTEIKYAGSYSSVGWREPDEPSLGSQPFNGLNVCRDLFGVGCDEGTSASGSRYVNSLTLTAPGKYPNGSAYSGRLNGELPDSLTLLEKLETLTLSGNALTGGLPASWSSMAALTSIVVDGNKLTGTIPRSWTNMARLTELDISGNPMACYYATKPAWLAEWAKTITLRATRPASCAGYQPTEPPTPDEPPARPDVVVVASSPPLAPRPVVTASPPRDNKIDGFVAPSSPSPYYPAPKPPSPAQPSSSFPVAAVAAPVAIIAVAGLAAGAWYLLKARPVQPPPAGGMAIAPAGAFMAPPPAYPPQQQPPGAYGYGGAQQPVMFQPAGVYMGAPAAQPSAVTESGRVIFYGSKV
jgi:hypothetical protein